MDEELAVFKQLKATSKVEFHSIKDFQLLQHNRFLSSAPTERDSRHFSQAVILKNLFLLEKRGRGERVEWKLWENWKSDNN